MSLLSAFNFAIYCVEIIEHICISRIILEHRYICLYGYRDETLLYVIMQLALHRVSVICYLFYAVSKVKLCGTMLQFSVFLSNFTVFLSNFTVL